MSKSHMVVEKSHGSDPITISPRQNGHVVDNILKLIFVMRIVVYWYQFHFVPKGPVNNNSALILIMAWRQQSIRHYRNRNDPFVGKCVSLGLNDLH